MATAPPNLTPADIQASIPFADLSRIVDENAEPWASVAQCDVFLRAASMYRRRMSTEAEKDGMRFTKTDINAAIEQCRKTRAALIFGGQATTVVVPPDELR